MFIGHIATAFGAKAAAPRSSLGTLLIAAQLPDLLFPVLMFAGIEHVRIVPGITRVSPLDLYDYPWSHSLALTLAWAGLVAGVAWLARRSARLAGVLAALVVGHWVLDLISHRPDLPLWPEGPLTGLGLWNSPAGTAVVELGLFALGLTLYLRVRLRQRPGIPWGILSLAALLIVVHTASMLGPPPTSTQLFALTGTVGSLVLVAWAYAADRVGKSAS